MSNHQRWPHFRDKTRGPRGTDRQLATLRALLRGNLDGTLLDIYELRDVLGDNTWHNTWTTVRTLMAHGLVERSYVKHTKKGNPRRTFIVTEKGRNMIRPRSLPTGDL